jgi:glycosyltransferase involved in cell wall biosynthesis
MKIRVFKNIVEENFPSMQVYANNLLRYMPGNVEDFAIRAKVFPGIKHYFHKEMLYPKIAARHQLDINHILDHSYAGILKYLNRRKTLVTCHDLIPLDYPEECSVLGLKIYRYNVSYLMHAAKIITNSEWTKKCILKHFSFNEKNIHVVYLGVSESFRPLNNAEELRHKYNIKPNTILHVGNSSPRKNVELILRILAKKRDLSLVKIGRFTKQQIYFIKKNGVMDRIKNYISVDQNSLIELYNSVDVLVMPSIAEGFNLPILEAMACGCPVVCSRIEPFQELYDGFAVLASVYSMDEMIMKIEEIIRNPKAHSRLIADAVIKSKKFSWQACANETYKIYEDLCRETL